MNTRIDKKNTSFKEMAKSSGIVAFVQIAKMIFGLLRNKLIALLIGASGFGIWSLYYTFIEMVSTFSVFGLDQGGVREIAKSSNDKEAIGKCIYTFGLAILLISFLSGLIVFILAEKISLYLFNTLEYINGIRIISVVVLVYGISKGGYAILNGVHALKYLAISQIISAIAGSLSAILLVYWGGTLGIPYALATVIISSAIMTVFYVRKLKIKIVVPKKVEFYLRIRSLLYLGLGFTVAGLISSVMTLQSRSFLSSHYNMDAVGIYQASWTISNLYIGIILSAMGIDFMPRLAKVSDDNQAMNKLINQQIEFGVALSSIGITFILLLSPIILQILYSSEFIAGSSIIRWQVLGVALRVLAFPFSYSIMAKGKSIQYAFIQVFFWTGDYLLLMLFSHLWGFDALGINYFVAYCFYLAFTYCACRYNHSFAFSRNSYLVILLSAIFIIITLVVCFGIKSYWVYVVGCFIWLIQFALTYFYVKEKMGIDILQLVRKRILKK